MIKGPKIDRVKSINLWLPKPMRRINLHIVSKKDFRIAALQNRIDPNKGGFAVWSWWRNDIYVMPHTLHLIPHEIRHLQERKNFNSGVAR